MQILKEGMSRAYFVKLLQQIAFFSRLKYGFMNVYIFLHLMAFDLILLALIMIFHSGNMQTLKEGMFRAYFVKHLQQIAFFSKA